MEEDKRDDDEGSDVELEGVEESDAEDDGGDDAEDDDDDDGARPAGGASAVDSAAAAAASAAEHAVLEEARRQQNEKLQSVRAEASAAFEGLSDSEKRARKLEYLMAQSEVFTHFLAGMGAIDEGKGAKKGKKGGGAGRTRVSEAAEDDALMKTAQQKHRVTRVHKQPANVTGEMRPYQVEGLSWMVKLHENGINGILADEMGLGKTLQSISLMGWLLENRGIRGPHIVIAPKSTIGNWMREIRQWCPSLKPLKLLGDKHERARIVQEELLPGKFDVCVTSYEGTLKEASSLKKIQWSYLMIDEAHRVKNVKSSLSQTVRLIPTQFRLLITGTPLQNNLQELWALLNFLLPDVFSSSDTFDDWFSLDQGDGAKDNVIKKLHTVLKPFMLRRVKKDVAKDLPPKREVKLYTGLTDMQKNWYTKILSKDASALNALGGPDRVRLLNTLMQLRKVCNHPYLFEGAEPGPPYVNGPHLWENTGKMLLLQKLLPKLKAQGSRVLIFSQMTRMLDILEDYFLLTKVDYCRIDGGTGAEEREAAMDEFNRPKSPKFAFLLSTRAGGLGINLATADIVILYDSDWNPQVDLQAMDRAHRIGQTKPVSVFRFITEGTVEEKIIERADKKLFLDAAVIQQGRLAEQNTALSKGDLMAMVRFGADEIFNGRGAQISDEDIDVILARGEERTDEQNSKIQSDMQHNLMNFTLEDDNDTSLFTFEGENYGGKAGSGGAFINLPQRERKRNYDVDEYFRDALRVGDKTAKEPGQRKRKGPVMHDFQFFERERLEELFAQEQTFYEQQLTQRALIKELRGKALREREGDAASSAETAIEAERLERELETLELSEEQKATRDALLNEGFGEWMRKDFKAFTSAMERNGRNELDTIASETAAETQKPEDEVRRYYATFWQKGPTALADWAKIVEKIEKGEKRIARSKEIREALRKKVLRYERPWQQLTVQYAQSRGKIWTEEEDAYLVNMMNRFGYGNWERMRMQIRHAWQFKLDWFFKSRNAAELQRRCDFLIKQIEKENEDVERSEKTKKKSPPKPAATKSEAPEGEDGAADAAVASKRPKDEEDDADGDDDAAATANGADAESPMDTAEDGTAEAPPRKLAKVEPEPES